MVAGELGSLDDAVERHARTGQRDVLAQQVVHWDVLLQDHADLAPGPGRIGHRDHQLSIEGFGKGELADQRDGIACDVGTEAVIGRPLPSLTSKNASRGARIVHSVSK